MKLAMAGASYKPQLDALRCLAVFAVLVHHFFEPQHSFLGRAGVRLFFVLSGFLITTILLRARESAERGSSTIGLSLKHFYVRRSLRFFPAFYLVILIGWAFGIPEIANSIVWHVTYTTNLLFAKQGYFNDYTAHLWSLAVEEQFYLIWPWVVLLINRRLLTGMAITLVVLGPLLKAASVALQFEGITFYVLPIGALDSLGSGALLAILRQTDSHHGFCKLGLLGLFTACLLLLAGPSDIGYGYVALDVAFSLGCACVVSKAFDGFQGFPGRVLESSAVLYFGKISYGIYLYHGFVFSILFRSPWIHSVATPLRFILFSATSILAAMLSWHCLERPLNNLKKFCSESSGRYANFRANAEHKFGSDNADGADASTSPTGMRLSGPRPRGSSPGKACEPEACILSNM